MQEAAEEERSSRAGDNIAETAVSTAAGGAALSKNQAKKLRRREHRKEGLAKKRMLERDKKRNPMAYRPQGMSEEQWAGEVRQKKLRAASKRMQKAVVRRRLEDVYEKGSHRAAAVVIDCSFDHLMTENEVISLSQQLSYCYSSNSRLLSVSSLFHIPHKQQQEQPEKAIAGEDGGKDDDDIMEEETKEDHQMGSGTHSTIATDISADKGVQQSQSEPSFSEIEGALARDNMKPFYLAMTSVNGRLAHRLDTTMRTSLNWKVVRSQDHFTKVFPGQARDKKIIYLTADSENELESVEEGCVYVLGGIVDRNRHKNLCKGEAEKYNLKTARFPIGQYMHLSSSSVLTVNQCFDLMLKYVETKSWEVAVETVIPKRKVTATRSIKKDIFENK